MIPVNEPLLAERDLELVTDCLKTGWISSAGKYLDDFEKGWAAYCGRRFGVAVANGTVALEMAVAALELPPGSEIIMPSFTIISCAQAVLYNDCVPVLVDCEPRTATLDVRRIERKITPKTRAIMPVHIYGHPVDMDPVMEIAARHKLAVIEDAAEAHGAEYHAGRQAWKRCGGFGELSCFSFYANKLVTTGEGGMVVTDDEKLAVRLRSLRNLCFQAKQRFLHEELGYNFRLTNLQAALGVAQLERMDRIVARKREIAGFYNERLAGLPNIALPVEEPWARSVYWMYGIVLTKESGMNALGLAEKLRARQVETRPYFLGMHEQPALKAHGLFQGESYPVTESLARQGLYLPSGLGITDEQLDAVARAIRDVLA